jgi:hypothetical protein
LCVFLALSALEKPAETILILDDVLASVDEPHVERLIEMLYAEALRFRHCIITTHYRPWRERFRWGWLKSGQVHFVELTKWTPETGMSLMRSVPDLERLKKLLSETSPDLQSICSKVGVMLEAALSFLTLHYECSLPRKAAGVYTLGDLLREILVGGRDGASPPLRNLKDFWTAFRSSLRSGRDAHHKTSAWPSGTGRRKRCHSQQAVVMSCNALGVWLT